MIVRPIMNEVITDEQDCVELGSIDEGYEMLDGWICEDGTMIYTVYRPLFHPYTGEPLTLEETVLP